MDTFSWASLVDAPRCGVRTAFSSFRNGESLGQRLLLEHIDGGAGDALCAQSLAPGGLVDDAAAGAVDDHDGWLHDVELGLADQVVGGRGERCMHGDEVGLAADLVQGHDAHAQLDRDLLRDVRVIADQLHAEGLGPLGHLAADAADADDTKGLA